jgi:hypothetical protein
MARKPKGTRATLCIVESLEFLQEDTHCEGEIISRTLRLSGKPTQYVYLRSRDELEAFVKEFGRSDHRYLHISLSRKYRRLLHNDRKDHLGCRIRKNFSATCQKTTCVPLGLLSC